MIFIQNITVHRQGTEQRNSLIWTRESHLQNFKNVSSAGNTSWSSGLCLQAMVYCTYLKDGCPQHPQTRGRLCSGLQIWKITHSGPEIIVVWWGWVNITSNRHGSKSWIEKYWKLSTLPFLVYDMLFVSGGPHEELRQLTGCALLHWRLYHSA
jgi:hypothetical protein